MVADGEYVAVLDRFEAGERKRLAVLLLERGGRQVDELVVPADDLPADARQNAVLTVTVADDSPVEATVRRSETADRESAAQERFDRLARRPGDASSGEDDETPGDDDRDGG